MALLPWVLYLHGAGVTVVHNADIITLIIRFDTQYALPLLTGKESYIFADYGDSSPRQVFVDQIPVMTTRLAPAFEHLLWQAVIPTDIFHAEVAFGLRKTFIEIAMAGLLLLEHHPAVLFCQLLKHGVKPQLIQSVIQAIPVDLLQQGTTVTDVI